MYKFIFLTFAFLAWAFYEMSGGADFEPSRPMAEATPAPVAKPESTPAVTRAAAAARPEPAAEVTRAAYTAPSYDLRAPREEELAAVDPMVLASFANVLKRDEEVAPVEVASTSDTLVVEAALDLREVTGNRVNMRNGPGTAYPVVSRLERGDEVEVLATPGNGWLKLRVTESGRIGWMADFLVSAAD